jgi:transcription termination factor Rho
MPPENHATPVESSEGAPATEEGATPRENVPEEGYQQNPAQQGQQQGGFGRWRDRRGNNRFNNRGNGRFGHGRFDRQHGRDFRNGGNQPNRMNGGNNRPQPEQRSAQPVAEVQPTYNFSEPFPQWDILGNLQALEDKALELVKSEQIFNYNELLGLGIAELEAKAKELGVVMEGRPQREVILSKILDNTCQKGLAIIAEGVIDRVGDEPVLVFGVENYRLKSVSPYLPPVFLERYNLKRGTTLKVQLHPARLAEAGQPPESRMPIVLKILTIEGGSPEANLAVTPFEELTPYYPTKRILLETHPDVKWDNFSMRIVDLLTPIGFGQRGLIVAPPRTGKTILLQGIANAIAENHPDAHLMVLLVDERPEEVTDFKRQIKGEVISSTFDETAQSHTHAAEVVIERARRLVERGKHVVILLDSITRLARAYNALTGNSGKIMSGGVESNALQKPKRFFGSARNIENGGSLTILGTALIDTGSKMDEVIFEEFKGTGNMELHLDRGLVDKRLFPAIALDKSGTRKEELLYHPDELIKIYGLRRAMKGVTPLEAMEMLLQRAKKTRTNIEFLMGLSR